MKGYGKRRYPWEVEHIVGYFAGDPHHPDKDRRKSITVFRSFTPFSKRYHKALTTNKARARREGRIQTLSGIEE